MTTALVPVADRWAAQAAVATKEEPLQQGLWVTTRGGVLAIGDDPLPGNQMYVVIIDHYRENTYFAEKWNPEQPAPPKCYAFSRGADIDDMGPHESMQRSLAPEGYFAPQSDTCAACPKNEYGSADTGKGKACQNRRRLMLLPAGFATPKRGSRDFDVELFTDPAHYASSDIAQLKLPVTSTKEYAKFVMQVGAELQRPPHGVIARIYLEPHPSFQYQVKFEVVEEIPDELADVIMTRNEAARSQPFPAYEPPMDDEPRQPVAGSLRGVGRR